MANIGLSFNPNKCTTLRSYPVRGKKCPRISSEPQFTINGISLPCTKIDGFLKYLGLHISPEGKIQEITSKVKAWLTNLRKYRLKPEQRMEILRNRICGRVIYTLRNGEAHKGVLEGLDKQIRKAVKETLHIPPGTPNAYFYVSSKHGGLGFIQLREMIPLSRLRAFEKLTQSEDPLLRQVARLNEKDLVALYRMTRNSHKFTPDERAEAFMRTEWGKDHESIKESKTSFAPLMASLRGYELVRSAQLLSGNLPTRLALHRGHTNVRENVTCRRCSAKTESAAHVLSDCPKVKDAYVKRHNCVRDWLARSLEGTRGREVLKEVQYQIRGERFRPDLTILTEDEIHIVEVSVPYAPSMGYLEQRSVEKEEKYLRPCFLEAVKMRFGEKRVSVRSVIVGARGGICGRAKANLISMGLGSRIACLQKTAIMGSLSVFDTFRAGTNSTEG